MSKTPSWNVSQITERYGAIILLLVLVAYNVAFTPNFFAINTVWNVFLQAFPILIIALGMTLVITTGGIDVSVGSTMAVSASVLAYLLTNDVNMIVAVLCALLAASLCGAFNGFLVAKVGVQPIIATLIILTAGRGIAQNVNEGHVISFFAHPIGELNFIRVGGVVPIQVIIIAILFGIFCIILKLTTLGRYIESVGGNPRVSKLSGIPMVKTKFVVYVIVAILAGVASVFEVSRISSADPNQIGRLIELDVIASVAVGGTIISGGKANIVGTVFGALSIQLITVTVNMQNIPFHYSLMMKSVVILLALWLQRRNVE